MKLLEINSVKQRLSAGNGVARAIFLSTFLWAGAGHSQPATPETNAVPVTAAFINELADEALVKHPSLQAAEKRIEAARENENGIRTWNDPVIRFGRVAAEKEMRRDDGDLVYEVEQELPLFGRPQAARDVAKAETETEKADADLKFQLLRKDIAVTAFDTALAEHTLNLGRRDLGVIEALVDIATRRYEERTGSQLEILRLQNEVGKRAQALRMDGVTLTNNRAQLNRLVGRSLLSPLPKLALPEIGPSLCITNVSLISP